VTKAGLLHLCCKVAREGTASIAARISTDSYGARSARSQGIHPVSFLESLLPWRQNQIMLTP